MPLERLDKILVSQNIGSRKEVKSLVKKGLVKVDGETQKQYDIKIDASISDIEVCGEKINFRRNMYIMMNKPSGVVSASNDSRARTVVDLVPKELYRRGLFPAGRLDKDTEGLLIITDDGDFAHRMLSPSNHVYKLYQAKVSGKVTEDKIKAFNEGIQFMDGTKCLPAHIKVVSEQGDCTVTEVSICEGKFHQVKKMFLAVGCEVLHLKRKRIGKLELDEKLSPGECRELTPNELCDIFLQ